MWAIGGYPSLRQPCVPGSRAHHVVSPSSKATEESCRFCEQLAAAYVEGSYACLKLSNLQRLCSWIAAQWFLVCILQISLVKSALHRNLIQ
jgi:hypothetical protein